jgi:hypothetical protein
MQPRHADAVPEREALGALAQRGDFGDDLMAGDDRQLPRLKLSLDQVQVRPAHATGPDTQEQLPWPRLRGGNVGQLQGVALHRS